MAHTRNRIRIMTPMQEAFVREYCLDRHQTNAALRAGYGGGTNRDTAQQMGSKLMRVPHVLKAIDAAVNKLARKTETSSEWVRRKLKEEAEDYSKGSSPTARVRAAELIGKLNGDFVEDRKNTRSPLQDFATEDLEQLEKALAGIPTAAGSEEKGPTTH